MSKPRTPEQKARAAAAARRYRAKNPERTRALVRAWKARNKRKIAEYTERMRIVRNAQARARWRSDPRRKESCRRWRKKNPGYYRVRYWKYHEKFVADGPFAGRAKRMRRAWRAFTRTCASNRHAEAA